MARIHHDNANTYLESEYTPSGLITDVDVAVDMFVNAGISVPNMNSPFVDLDKWREFIDILSPKVITKLGETLPYRAESEFFKALSIKVDSNSPYTVTDIITIEIGPEESDKDNSQETIEHIIDGFEYVLKVLPPVTSGMIGSWLSTIKAFDEEYYTNEILPEEYSWTGLHYPRRREIQMTTGHWNDFPDDMEYPQKSHTFTSTLIHEIGHTVHNIYGFHRPDDSGFDYPSEKYTLGFTGIVPQSNISPKQEQFIMEAIRSYTLNQREEFNNIHYNGYGTTHPAESFACAFDELLRKGGDELVEKYEQFSDLFTLLV